MLHIHICFQPRKLCDEKLLLHEDSEATIFLIDKKINTQTKMNAVTCKNLT